LTRILEKISFPSVKKLILLLLVAFAFSVVLPETSVVLQARTITIKSRDGKKDEASQTSGEEAS